MLQDTVNHPIFRKNTLKSSIWRPDDLTSKVAYGSLMTYTSKVAYGSLMTYTSKVA